MVQPNSPRNQALLINPRSFGCGTGPYGGGLIEHPFFKDFEAPIQFNSVDMLEKYINKVFLLPEIAAVTAKF
jgi:hypothetical protein